MRNRQFTLTKDISTMYISYRGLWKKLREKKLKKQNLVDDLKLSSATVAKMGKGEPVSFKVMDKLCEYLDCDINEIITLHSSPPQYNLFKDFFNLH